jgi:PTS system nitrogen regulatory IIA component
MRVQDLLTPERTFILQLQHNDKADLLQQLAGLAAVPGCNLTREDVFNALMARERLGSTGIGEGVAIPHCRLPCCDTPQGILLKLAEPVEFDSLDGRPVDLVFALLTPAADAEAHLKVLSHLAALFNQPEYRDALRAAASAADLYQQAAQSSLEQQLAS